MPSSSPTCLQLTSVLFHFVISSTLSLFTSNFFSARRSPSLSHRRYGLPLYRRPAFFDVSPNARHERAKKTLSAPPRRFRWPLPVGACGWLFSSITFLLRAPRAERTSFRHGSGHLNKTRWPIHSRNETALRSRLSGRLYDITRVCPASLPGESRRQRKTQRAGMEREAEREMSCTVNEMSILGIRCLG